MSKVTVSGRIRINAADREKALALIAPLVTATRAEEGNLSYGFYEDVLEANSFLLYEEWKDEAALDHHMSLPHIAAFMEGVATIDVQELTVTFHHADPFERG